MPIRKTAVAGTFYPKDPERLRDLVRDCLGPPAPSRGRAKAVVAPHAGYIYSGRFAGQAYARVEIPNRVIVLCPNHTGRGPRVSLWPEGAWETPFGEVPIDEALADRLLSEGEGMVTPDTAAHAQEHGIEVHLPFLLAINPGVRIVPIVVGPLTVESCQKMGAAVARAVGPEREPVLLVASTDMSHYVPATEAKAKDTLALAELERLDAEGLYRVASENDISMCGLMPTTSTLVAAKALGATRSRLVAYGHSGERTGDLKSVVAYASAILD